MTEPCLRFFRSDSKLTEFLGYHAHLELITQGLWKHGDAVHIDAEKLNKETGDHIFGGFNFVAKVPPAALADFMQTLCRMGFCAAVDNFLTYISDLLTLIYKTKPEALRSSHTMKTEEILRYKSMSDLVAALAERRVYGLAYKGMADLNEELYRTLGFQLFTKPSDLRRGVIIIEVRNLAVHNRSVVNAVFLTRVKHKELKVGDEIPMEVEMLLAADNFLGATVTDIDNRAAAKFGLPRPIHRKDCGL